MKIVLYQILIVLFFLGSEGTGFSTTYTLIPGGSITTLAHWKDATNASPANFTSSDTWFFDANNAALTLNSAWAIDAGATVILGDGTNAFTLTYSGSASIGSTDAFVVMNNNSTLVLNTPYNFNNAKTTFNSGTLIYSTGTSSVASDQYFNLTIDANVATNNSTVNVIGNLTINSGNSFLIDNSGILNASGQIISTGGTFSGDNSGTLNFNGGAADFYFKTGFENFAFISLQCNGFMLLHTPLNVSNNFSVSGGGYIWLLGGSALNLNGNIVFGSFGIRSSGSGSITIGGTGTITGNLYMDFNPNFCYLSELTLNRSGATLNLGNQLNIVNSVNPTSGTISTNGNLYLYNDATFKGRIGPISASGALSGNVTVNLFKPSGTTNWLNLCSSGLIGKNFSDWNTSFAITCPSGCPDGSVVAGQPFTSVYTYDETQGAGTASAAAHYVDLPGTSTSIDSKAGYWVYLGNGYPNTSNITIALTGAVNTKGSSGPINLSVTGGAGSENGWNLIANPYPSPIQVSQVLSAFSGSIDATSLCAYDPDISNWVSYSAAGANSVIPMGQAFYLRATSSAAVTPDETWKTSTADNTSILKNPGFQIPLGANGKAYDFNDFLLDLQSNASPVNFFSQVYFAIDNAASSSYDLNKDVLYLDNPINPNAPSIFCQANPERLKKNVISLSSGSVSIPIQVSTGYSGNYTLKPVNLDKLPSGACVILKNLLNNQSHDLRSGAYTCTLTSGAGSPQFELQISLNTVPLGSSALQHPQCTNMANGYIKATGSGNGPWNYVWKDQNNYLLQKTMNTSVPDTLSQLSPGIYNVEVSQVGSCNQASAQFTLQALMPQPISAFQADQISSSIFAWEPLHFSNLSQHATSFSWDFGNGLSAGTFQGSVLYENPGTYTVQLRAFNDCGEESLSTSTVQISANPLGISFFEQNRSLPFPVVENHDLFIMNPGLIGGCTLEIYSLLGQKIFSKQTLSAQTEKVKINLQASGQILLIRIADQQSSKNFKLVF